MIRITDDKMTGHASAITATRVSGPDEHPRWTVSWLPGGEYSRNQAITALTMAEMACSGGLAHEKGRIHFAGWLQELNQPFDVEQALWMIGEASAARQDADDEPPAAPGETPPAADVAELRAIFTGPVEGRDWHAMRPRDFGLAETHTQTAMLLQTDPGTLF